jgi:DNA-binding transcriptional ArsR family regulator
MNGNGPTARIDLLLHPVRLRVVAEFGGGRRTVRELAAALPDVAQSTLYRQVGILVDAGVLELVDQRATTGPDERVYRVAPGGDRVPAEEVDRLPPAEHLRYFSRYVAALVDTLSRYLHGDGARPSVDGLAYQRTVVHLSDAERAAFAARLAQLVGEMRALPPDPTRRRFHLASVVVPEPSTEPPTEPSSERSTP